MAVDLRILSDGAARAVRSATVLTGDCRAQMLGRGPYDLIIADPPYGDTALGWDRQVEGWLKLAHDSLRPTGSIWVFGSLRSFLRIAPALRAARLRLAQDIVWQKSNGTGMAADRFKRVHELVAQFYRADGKWAQVYNDVRRVSALHRNKSVRIRRADRFGHTGRIGIRDYHDDGTRIMKSVIGVNSVRGGIHLTQKPVELLAALIETSCPRGGLVGDWFAGSGAAGEACIRTGRRYLGCEIDPAMAERARLRLQGFAAFYPEDGDD
ncbi:MULTISPECIES: DNA-methyltransferase [Sphingobium]|jgi:site-specific DNA-methyltransferase (adenine-specific)|uniref:Methyltransferase n=3 Tax=Sphingobium TaxID=165695 RepID=T0HUC2_9SPHN|nr:MULTISPECIES: DNA methyltransferase [Sphingobium]EQB16717.1 DNA methylase [Sphingobium lactosutens DS20]QDC36627.1 site-specific DNA-methyltransferase [Sphingobium fuliginis ATCC 27551]QNG43889.1 site-specific DNA-methyltransferase [Sphingobium yanoikuyae]